MRVIYLDEHGEQREAIETGGIKILFASDEVLLLKYGRGSKKQRAYMANGKIKFNVCESSGLLEIPITKIIEKQE